MMQLTPLRQTIDANTAAALEDIVENGTYTLLERLIAARQVIRYLQTIVPYQRTIVPLDADERHIINVHENGWTIQHPLSCRSNPLGCLTTRVASDANEYINEHLYGRFVCKLNDGGQLEIEEKIAEKIE